MGWAARARERRWLQVRVLRFDGSDESKARFRYLFTAVINGPLLTDDGKRSEAKRSWDTQRADGKIIRAFKAISHDKDGPADASGESTKTRHLNDDGGVVRLTGEQWKKLDTWWQRLPWPTYDIDLIESCYEWFCDVPDEKPEVP